MLPNEGQHSPEGQATGHRKYSSQQLRRLCPGDVRASGGSILLVPMIALSTVDLEECVRGVTETGELLLSSVANALRQRGLELYVIITKPHGYQHLGANLPTPNINILGERFQQFRRA